MRALALRPLPLSGACWFAGSLYLRLEGSPGAVDAAQAECRSMLPEAETTDAPPWDALRDFQLPVLGQRPLWCLSLAPATPLGDATPLLIDWAGARRLFSSEDTDAMQALAESGGGAAQRLRGGDSDAPAQPEPPPPMRALLQRLKHAMDPAGILNPGRLHAWL
jgi:glycolate oxidase FAD binding subunit